MSWLAVQTKENPLPDSSVIGSGSLKVPGCELSLLWLSFRLSHNQRAASLPMMVGMMVCAVVVVCAPEAHNLIHQLSREMFLYPTLHRVSMKQLTGLIQFQPPALGAKD